PVDLDTGRATLTRRAAEDGAVIPIGPGDWAVADCRKAPFPGTPDPTRLSVKGGFDPAYLYELVYTAKDPPVLGIGLAATRQAVARGRPRHPVAPARPPLLLPPHGPRRRAGRVRHPRQSVGPLGTGGQSEPAVRDHAGLARRPDRLGRERHGTAAEPVSAPGRG